MSTRTSIATPRRYHRILTAAALGLSTLSLIPASDAQATTGSTIIVDQDIVLSADHVGNLVVTAAQAVIDCDGHVISSPTPLTGFGVDVPAQSRVTVQNCHIIGYQEGISAEYADALTVRNSEFEANGNGIWAVHVPELEVLNNDFHDNEVSGLQSVVADTGHTKIHGNAAYAQKLEGIHLSFTPDAAGVDVDVSIIGNSINANHDYGLVITSDNTADTNYSAANLTIIGNQANSNGYQGMFISSPAPFEITGNATMYNGADGLFIHRSESGGLIQGNAINYNDEFGFQALELADNLFVHGNQVVGNGADGIRIEGADNGHYAHNVAVQNGQTDAHRASGDGNTFAHNAFGTTIGIP